MLPLARALLQAGQGAEAVALFERALAQQSASDAAALERELTAARRVALRQQFDADMERGDWRAAERSWTALLRIEPSTLEAAPILSSAASTMVKLAVAAAGKGDGTDALRLWRGAANIDRAAGLGQLNDISLTRYRAELTAFYEAMVKRDSGSWVPAVALKNLGR